MENKKENNMLSSVKFLFGKPSHQGYYFYCLDDLDSMQIIDKESLKNLLLKLGCMDFIKTNYYLDRNMIIFYDCKEKKYKEFKESDLNKDELSKMIYDELKENTIQTNKSVYESLFGKDSTFYQTNFAERLNIWRS